MSSTGIDEGYGVLVRPARDSDRPRWWAMTQDPDYRFAAPAGLTLPDEEGLAKDVEESLSAWSSGSPGNLVVAPAADPAGFLGTISWRWTNADWMGIADIGYGVHPDARGRGTGRAAIVTLTRWLLDPQGRGLARVQLDHSTENAASCRVALGAGFEREGIRKGYLPLHDPDGAVRRHDVCLHGIVRPPTL